MTPLGPGREFEIIRRILEDARESPELALAGGDDCALLRSADGYLAVSVDMTIEGVHYRSDWGTPELVGRRAVAAALSDLAAVGADPIGVLAAISVPRSATPEIAESIGLGCRAAAESYGALLLGGDLSRGSSEVVIDIAALGTVSKPLLRDGARPGDELWVTGRLGGAAAAVAAWKEGEEPNPEWRDRFWQPVPRLREARWLAAHDASAAIDISDGLAADANHMAAASGVGVELDLAQIPLEPDVEPATALTGGEDYELLVAVPTGILNDDDMVAEFEAQFGIALTQVARVVSGEGVTVYDETGTEIAIDRAGFDHFE